MLVKPYWFLGVFKYGIYFGIKRDKCMWYILGFWLHIWFLWVYMCGVGIFKIYLCIYRYITLFYYLRLPLTIILIILQFDRKPATSVVLVPSNLLIIFITH